VSAALELRRVENTPRWILAATGVTATVGLLALWPWQHGGGAAGVYLFFYQGAALVTGLSSVGLLFSLQALRGFSPGEPMRKAWFMMAASSACHMVCGFIAQMLAIQSLADPSAVGGVSGPALLGELQRLGLVFGGPIPMVFLSVGLLFVLRVFRKSGLWERLTRLDWSVLALVGGFGAYRLGQAGVAILAGNPLGVPGWLNLASGPMLALLVGEAFLILRSVVPMGRGLVAKCWAAFAAAILLTTLGNVGMWVAGHGSLSAPLTGPMWCLWFAASAAYALGPTYQVAAARRATMPAGGSFDPLSIAGLPAGGMREAAAR